MKTPEPKPLRTRSVGTKLTETEYAQCERTAAQFGLAVGEWCRQVVLEASTLPTIKPESEVILGEFLALRKILINLIYRRERGEQLTEEFVRELIDTADSDKISKGAERLQVALQARFREGATNDGKHIDSIGDTRGNSAKTEGLAE